MQEKGKATFSFSARTSKQRTEKKENRYWLNHSNFKMNYVSKDGNFSQHCCQISHCIPPQFTQLKYSNTKTSMAKQFPAAINPRGIFLYPSHIHLIFTPKASVIRQKIQCQTICSLQPVNFYATQKFGTVQFDIRLSIMQV